jgi:hypothetical protein
LSEGIVLLKKYKNKIYIKYNKENHAGYLSAIISVGFLAYLFINNFNKIQFNNKWLDDYIHSNFIKVLFIIGLIIFIVISIMNKIFYSDYNYYIDLEEKKMHLINGRWKFKTENIIKLDEIKYMVIIRSEIIVGRYGKKMDKYKIDIYDCELNAYEIFDSMNYGFTLKIANKINDILNTEILKMTDINNYEGFRKRIL